MITGHTSLESQKADHPINLRLFGFVLVSIILHTIILLSQQTTNRVSETPLRTMQVTLGSIKTIEAPIKPPSEAKTNQAKLPRQTTAKPKPAEQAKRTMVASNEVEPPSQSVVAEEPVYSHEQPPVTTTAITKSNNVSEMEQQAVKAEQQRMTLTQRLRQALNRHFYYPKQARRQGWQGEVLLSFTLNKNGTISNILIAQSSEYGILDRAAIDALNRVQAIDVQLDREFSLEIPISYGITE